MSMQQDASWLKDKTADGPAIEAAVEQRHMLRDAKSGSDALLRRLKKHHDIREVTRDTVDHPLNGSKK